MEEIAAEAGVGQGTLYRRFSDRGSLALALLETDHANLQENFIRGEPPLGPGAPPRERLRAFFAALSCHLERHGDLIAEAERSTPAGQRFTWGVNTAWHAHVRILLNELNPTLDNDVLAHVLLAPFRAEIHRHLTGDPASQGRDRLLAALGLLIDGLDAHAGR
jgi:AcrR family transcriptional regulator